VKTHELGRALRILSDALLAGPDIALREVRIATASKPDPYSTASLAVNLSTLASLSRVDKTQLWSLIREYNLPIEVRPRDASRDILGKLLSYLEADPNARERLQHRATGSARATSPELIRALQSLLRDDK
jgi:hypothetical protein